MTDEELISTLVPGTVLLTPAESARLRDLLRRGLRAEREVCGRCAFAEPAYDNKGQYCYLVSRKVVHTDFCSRWRAKEGE